MGPGLLWAGSSGTSAGSYASTCKPDTVALVPGETVTLTVWGDLRSPFGLFAATSASQCLVFPGLRGGLVLDFPVVPVGGGVLSRTSPCLSCPEAFETVSFAVPPSLPVGVTLAVQAVSQGGRTPAFTVAIVATS